MSNDVYVYIPIEEPRRTTSSNHGVQSSGGSSFSEALSYALQRLKMTRMTVKEEQRSSMRAVYEGSDVWCDISVKNRYPGCKRSKLHASVRNFMQAFVTSCKRFKNFMQAVQNFMQASGPKLYASSPKLYAGGPKLHASGLKLYASVRNFMQAVQNFIQAVKKKYKRLESSGVGLLSRSQSDWNWNLGSR